MKKKKIEIELLSDTCVSDGGIYNSAVDTDICQDDFGFPYIPGKRIKGSLRECALELNDWGAGIEIETMFGKQGNQRGQVIIKNAYIKGRDFMIETIRALPDTAIFHPQNILGCYSYIRTQTALDFDTGAADDKSLRTIRVAKKGLVFEAEVIFLSDAPGLEENLKKCLAVFRHIGISRTRGLGEIRAEILEEDSFSKGQKSTLPHLKETEYRENSTRLKYEIYLKEPIICKSVGEQEASSMDYIEGAKILGMIGQRLKNKGEEEIFLMWLKEKKIACSNAYPWVDGRRLYEVPASVFSIKNDKNNYRNKIYMDKEQKQEEEMPSCDKGLQLNQAKHQYVFMTEDGNMVKYSVDMEERYHHSRPDDKSIGRVSEGADGSQLYQISSIKNGQIFSGFVEGDVDAVKKIYDLFVENKDCFIGYGRNGEYGECRIFVTELDKKEADSGEVETDSFYALLKSPTIIYNDKAMYSTETKDLQAEILKAVLLEDSCYGQNSSQKENGEIEVTKYINITNIGGYNVTWGCRKPTILAFDKGTVLVFKAPKNIRLKIKTGQIWAGERCSEGFGEIMISPLASSGMYKGRIVKKVGEEKEPEQEKAKKENAEKKGTDDNKEKYDVKNLLKQDFVQKIIKQRFEEFLRFKASVAAQNMEKESHDILRPTVSNLMLICKENNSVESVWDICKERFSKRSGKKDKKLECAKKIIKHIRTIGEDEKLGTYPLLSDITEEFGNQYHITGFLDENKISEWELAYLMELLVQIKYMLRRIKGDEKR